MVDQPRYSSHDTAIGWMILSCLLIALFALYWFYFEFETRSAYRWLRWGEMWVVSHFVEQDFTVPWKNYRINLHEWLGGVPGIPPRELNNETLGVISTLAMYPARIPVVAIISLMGLWAMIWGPGTQFRRKLNLDGLIKVQAKVFPIIAPVVEFNPAHQPPRPPGAKVPAELPPFAEALGPEEWLAYNEIPLPDGEVDEQAAFVAFTRQLGPRWQGPLKMAPYRQVLMAAFFLKAARKRTESDAILGRLAKCWSHKNGLKLGRDPGLLREAQKVLRNRDLTGPTLTKCNQHAFENTVLLRALATAREEGGVLAPAQFVWLRAFDRNLWYPLNNLGRQSYHTEALGAMAHFKAERLTRRPIPKPKVGNAVQSIAEYMKSPRARPVPELDYSQSKKRGIKKPKIQPRKGKTAKA